jgi:site-specific recombinase XerC
VEAILDEFDNYLALQRGRSTHTRRAYLGDLRALFAFLDDRAPGTDLQALSLPVLRSWLAAGAGAGAARTTLATRLPGCRRPRRVARCRRCCDKTRPLPPCQPRNPVPSKVIRSRYGIG